MCALSVIETTKGQLEEKERVNEILQKNEIISKQKLQEKRNVITFLQCYHQINSNQMRKENNIRVATIQADVKYYRDMHTTSLDEIEECKTKLAKSNTENFIHSNLLRERNNQVKQLEKTKERITKELCKKNVTIKRLQSDLHHYYNRRR